MNVAVVDIGTNSVRLFIVGERAEPLEREMTITRLGQGVDVTGNLHPDAIARTLAALSSFGALIRQHGVGRIRATATSAARDARNREPFFDAVEAALGARPELLSGEEEARLSFRGATAGLPSSDGPFLVIDVGGGSTEFVLGSSDPEALISLDIGAVRLTERHLPSDPPRPEELAACQADIALRLDAVRSAVPVSRARCTIGVAGSITTLASLSLGLTRYDAGATHHARLSRERIAALFARLASSTIEQRRRLLAEPKRAEVIVGGAAIVLGVLREFDIDELLVSETDILDGLASELIAGSPRTHTGC
jgi:exopolyphosphatase/guanosine-5'-triphosphate,3'-diphosphate pyrophosphatase